MNEGSEQQSLQAPAESTPSTEFISSMATQSAGNSGDVHADTQRSLQQASIALEATLNRIIEVRRSLLRLSESLPNPNSVPRFNQDDNGVRPGHEAILLAGAGSHADDVPNNIIQRLRSRLASTGADVSLRTETHSGSDFLRPIHLPPLEPLNETSETQLVHSDFRGTTNDAPIPSRHPPQPSFSISASVIGSSSRARLSLDGLSIPPPDPTATTRGVRVAAREANARAATAPQRNLGSGTSRTDILLAGYRRMNTESSATLSHARMERRSREPYAPSVYPLGVSRTSTSVTGPPTALDDESGPVLQQLLQSMGQNRMVRRRHRNNSSDSDEEYLVPPPLFSPDRHLPHNDGLNFTPSGVRNVTQGTAEQRLRLDVIRQDIDELRQNIDRIRYPPLSNPVSPLSMERPAGQRRGWARLDADGDEISADEEDELERARTEYRIRAQHHAEHMIDVSLALPAPSLHFTYDERNGRHPSGSILLGVENAQHYNYDSRSLDIDPLPMPLTSMVVGDAMSTLDELPPDIVVPWIACLAGR
ncbi:hypothetical protein BDN70DRAFT_994015 [Pholiota conissans]|uniref:Uncharacterized protein n=1 Tax=Pholiota conissans TaxID=109636 RepID=A0A9P5Z0T7_9AGAR|nr:hypothetical protein BDN70DRAFT_994015 [Pholiota conissans]